MLSIYEFIACDQKLSTFEEALSDEQIKSYNELLKMGLKDEQIRIRGIDLSKVERDKKIFYIPLPEELQNSPLVIEEDFHHPYARYLTNKKFIYKVVNAQKAITHLAGYIGKYSDIWRELELWRVTEDDYGIDSSDVPKTIINLRDLTVEKVDIFYEGTVPNQLVLVQN